MRQKKISVTEKENFVKGFYVKKIDDEIFARIKGKSFKDDCILPVEDLLDIFQKLYAANYPIEKIRLVDEYNADDETSMRDNNSSCFNFRFISHTTRVSKHGLGFGG